MTKYGVAIAQSAVPIDRASDYQRVIDTRWKTMSIVKTVPVNISSLLTTPGVIKITDHNLGYIPAFEAPFYNTRFEVGVSESGSYLFLADRESIYLVVATVASPAGVYSVSGNVIVYDLNMEVDYKGDDAGLVGAVGSTAIGMKLIGNDQYKARDVHDTDPLGFSVSTDSKAIGVDRVGTVQITGGVPFSLLGRGVVSHNLNYPPLIKTAKVYQRASIVTDSSYTLTPPSMSNVFYGQLGLTYAKVEPQKVVLQSYFNDNYRYVLFKEPVEIAG